MSPEGSRTSKVSGASSRSRATSYDVAQLAGVSQSAVSRAFRVGSSVSVEMRAKIEEAAQRLGYAPSQLARSLVTQRSRLIGVIITDITARNYPDVLRVLAHEIRRTGNQMLLCPVPDDDGGAAGAADLLAFHVDAIVSSAMLPPQTLQACQTRGTPVVLYNRVPASPLAKAVVCDHEAAMEALIAHLDERGLGRVVYLAGPANAPISNARLQAARQALSSRRVCPVRVVHGDYSYEGGRAVANSVLQAERPDTVICGNDAMAFGVLDGLRFDLDVRKFGSVSVTGFDDVQQASWPTYDLTTLSQPIGSMAHMAVTMLVDLGAVAEQPRLFMAELKIRGSTRKSILRRG